MAKKKHTKDSWRGGYKSMWLFAMFDLPVKEDEDKKEYVRFRSKLLDMGFGMVQFSVYARFCAGEDFAEKYRNQIKKELPAAGQVRVIAITDKQYGKMEVFYGKSKQKPEKPVSQLMLF